MPPNQSRRNKAAVTQEGYVEDDEHIDILPLAQGGSNILSKAVEMTKNNEKRRDTQRKAVIAEHDQRVKFTKDKIIILFGDRKIRLTKSQQALWQRLHDLNKRREDLEARILASMKNIKKETGNIYSEMNVVFEGRIQDIEAPKEAE